MALALRAFLEICLVLRIDLRWLGLGKQRDTGSLSLHCIVWYRAPLIYLFLYDHCLSFRAFVRLGGLDMSIGVLSIEDIMFYFPI